MAFKKLLAAGLLLASIAGDADARRRAVRIPGPPVNPVPIAQPVSAVLPASGSTAAERYISMTNHADATKTATLCHVTSETPGMAAGCKTYEIAPGATSTADISRDFQGLSGVLMISADMDKLEVRNGLRAERLDELLGAGQRAYLLGPDNAFRQKASAVVYTTQDSTVRLTLTDRFGGVLSERTETLPAFSVENYTYLHETARQDNTALEVTVESGRADAYLRMWDSWERQPIVIPASGPRSEAFLPASTVTLKNANTTNVNNVIWEHYASDQDNTFPATTSTALLNSETLTEQELFSGGAIHAKGLHPATMQARSGYTKLPVFSLEDAATARGSTHSTTPDVNLSINGLNGGNIDIINTSPGPVEATVTSYDANGNPVGTQTRTILRQSHTSLDVPNAARVMIDVADNTNQQNEYTPRVMAYATTTLNGQTVVKEGYKIEQVRKVTGEEYVASWFDGLKRSAFYLDNGEIRCMINGNCSTRSYKADLARQFTRSPLETWTQSQFEDWLTTMANGKTSSADSELWRQRDPYTWSSQNAVAFSLTTSQSSFTNEPGTIAQLPSDATETVFNATRQFLVEYVATHPEKYGGNNNTGPDLAFDPTWHSRNNN